eukprot:jgi/Ulvmu1/11307/UM074_0022.1
MASCACLSRAHFLPTRTRSRKPNLCAAIRPAPLRTARFASTRDARTHSAASLQTLTVDEEYQIEIACLQAQADELTAVRDRIRGLDDASQVSVLRGLSSVSSTLEDHRDLDAFISQNLAPDRQVALLATVAAGQAHVLTLKPEGGDWKAELTRLADVLAKVHRFYDALGGIVGYQLKCMQLICDAKAQEYADSCSSGTEAQTDDDTEVVDYLKPQGPNFQGASGRLEAQRAAGEGLRALPSLAEIYPLGGAGDRLGLVCDDTGEPLPSAMLPYCGRPMIAGLLRDLTAREYLHFRLFGSQHTTPVAIMTSDAKGNHRRVSEVLAAARHFGRPARSFRLFCQPLVPVLEAATGLWVLPAAMRPSLKPGGHGAIWKLMHDNGIFDWLAREGRTAALIRQISNPMAATDCTMLALAGTGHAGGRTFGFASCNRAVGASEGMNVLMRRRSRRDGGGWEYEYGVTNVEYTEFQRLGIADVATEEGGAESCFPANTNILYVGLAAAAGAIQHGIASGEGGPSLPGMIFNLSKQVTYTPAAAPGEPPREPRVVHAGRMECTMQNLADALTQRFPAPLEPAATAGLGTFVVFNERRYVTSSAKRARQPGSAKVAQTPEGSFLDLMRNAADLLALCGVRTPPMCSTEEYLDRGCTPPFVWVWNPALGPLWSVVAQKVSGGYLAAGAEVDLEIAELCWRDVHVDGSLLVHAEQPLGAPDADGAVRFSATHVGRARLEGVTIRNRGLDACAGAEGGNGGGPPPCHWKRDVPRLEACQITLKGRSEFVARDVTIAGDAAFEVPDGQRCEVYADASAACGYSVRMSTLASLPSWRWDCHMESDNQVTVAMVEPVAAEREAAPAAAAVLSDSAGR